MNKIVIFSAPSGAGKTTIVRRLIDAGLPLEFSISATSRTQRAGEQHARDYYFLTADEFRQRIEKQEFIEWEEVYTGMFYGTLRSEIDRIWSHNRAAILDVDVAGGLNIKHLYGEQALAVFVMPPSIEALRQRLINRGTETPESLAKRVGKAEQEITHAPEYDNIIVNNDLETAVAEAHALVSTFLFS